MEIPDQDLSILNPEQENKALQDISNSPTLSPTISEVTYQYNEEKGKNENRQLNMMSIVYSKTKTEDF